MPSSLDGKARAADGRNILADITVDHAHTALLAPVNWSSFVHTNCELLKTMFVAASLICNPQSAMPADKALGAAATTVDGSVMVTSMLPFTYLSAVDSEVYVVTA